MRITSQRPAVRSITKLISTRRSLVRILLIVGIVSTVTALSSASSANVFRPMFARAAAIFAGNSKSEVKNSATTSSLNTEETEQVSPSTTMTVERRGHTATRLSDGRVLIAGGENSSGPLNQAEIYDPATAEFSATGNLNSARADHTATKLGDGRVLIAGGRNGAGAVSTTEIFDPATGTFVAGPNMSVARAGHSATLFADGRILFAGGDGAGSAEIMDSALSGSTSVASMGSARSKHSAALMNDGRVLVVGGRDGSGNGLTSGEIFDGSSFTAIDGSLKVARVSAWLRVLFDGKVQIIGGNNDGSMEIYDPQISTFGAYAHALPEGDTCAGLPGQIQNAQTRAALIHNGQSDPTLDRSSHSMTELGGQAIVVGGANSAGAVLGSTPLFTSSNAAISTDKLDYAPGETAHITGRGFQAGEAVRLKIHEDPHTPQERGMDVMADGDGNFTADYLVMDYDLDMKFLVGARGLLSGLTAQTTFTDGAVRVKTFGTGGAAADVDWAKFSSGDCSGSPTTSGTISAVTTGSGTDIPDGTTSGSLRLTAQPVVGFTFANWSGAIGPLTSPNTSNPICLVHQNGTRNIDLTYSGNSAPVASSVSVSGTPQYAQLLTGNYTYSDVNGDAQGISTFRWLRDGVTVVSTSQTYTTVGADVGHSLTFEVTPVALTGVLTGAPVQSAPVTIAKAPSTTTINCPTNVTYTGLPLEPCTATATGAGGLNVPVTVVYGNNTNAGTATADASYAGDTNHEGSTATQKTFIIDKASSSTTIDCPTNVTYTGSPLEPCTATATGAGGLNVPVTVVYGNNTNAGTATADATYAGDTNHEGSTATQKTFTIDKRTLTASIIGDPTKTYDGNTDATLTPANFSIGNLVSGQSITVTKTTGTYNSKDVLTANTVSTTLAPSDFTAGVGTNLNNYNLPTSASGAGHITTKSLVITADNKSFLFGDPLPTLTASFNAFASGENVSNLTGTLTFTIKNSSNVTVPYNSTTPAGTYTIVPSGVSSTNYAISFVNGTLTIGAWTITGFYQPVDMNIGTTIVLNTIKGGSTVPLKFNIFAGTPGSATERKSVSDVMFGSVRVDEYPCSMIPGYDSPMDVPNTGQTSLRYDTTGGQFIQNWQTPKAPNKCYQVRMTALDGSHIDAFFKTK